VTILPDTVTPEEDTPCPVGQFTVVLPGEPVLYACATLGPG
jgi:hypothetical protein